MRDFLVDSDHGRLACATSAWCVIDRSRRRPARLPPEVRAILPPRRPRALERRFRRPPRPQRVDRCRRIVVTRDDLDVNRHVNHVRYLDWALATLPPGLRRQRLANLEVEFTTESSLGEELTSEVEVRRTSEPYAEAVHRIVAGDGREVARLRTLWSAAAPETVESG